MKKIVYTKSELTVRAATEDLEKSIAADLTKDDKKLKDILDEDTSGLQRDGSSGDNKAG